MTLTTFSAPYYDPSSTFYTGGVPLGGTLPPDGVLIGDRWYLLDLASDRFREASVPALRPQADTSERPGEQTLSIEGLWRRTAANWSLGAGQAFYDRLGSTPLRFWHSRGVDPWTEWEVSLLPAVNSVQTGATNWTSISPGVFAGVRKMVACTEGGVVRVFSLTGTQNASFTLTGPAYVASAGTGTYVGHAGGISRIDDNLLGTTIFNANVTGVTALGFVKGRLIAGKGAQLWDVRDATTAAAHYTNPWPDYKWTSFAEQGDSIYAAGYSGDRGQVWRIPILEDGSALDAPRVAVDLPDGEVPFAVLGYVGYVLVGTSKGMRVGQPTSEGLVLGPLVGDGPCRCLEGQDRFVWFGWDNTFPDAAGLGRADLSQFVQALGPAYTTDALGTTAGTVGAVATAALSTAGQGADADRVWFAVDTGLYRVSSTNTLASGYIETGWITHGLADDKVAVALSVEHAPLRVTESVGLELAPFRGESIPVYAQVGTSNSVSTTSPFTPFLLNNDRATAHAVRVTLNNGTPTTIGPILHSTTITAQPAPQRSSVLFLPLLLHEVVSREGYEYGFNPAMEVSRFREYVRYQRLLRVRMAGLSFLGFVEDYEWVPHHADNEGHFWQGTMVIRVKAAEVSD